MGSSQGSSVVTSSSTVARDRLSVILASQRGSELLAGVDMEALQRDVLEVVQKHIQVAKNKPVQCQVNSEGQVNLFEMAVELSQSTARSATGPTNVTAKS